MKKNHILISAIIFSAAWHIFWLSAFTVVVVPKVKKNVKFSNVSFMGPILEKGVLNVNIKSHDRTSLEKKYFDSIEPRIILSAEEIALDNHVMPALDITQSYSNKEGLEALVITSIDTVKIEPGREVD
ncbi:MAG: hypothetical protein WC404_01880 [Candidatus Omnitrophota bacterium]